MKNLNNELVKKGTRKWGTGKYIIISDSYPTKRKNRFYIIVTAWDIKTMELYSYVYVPLAELLPGKDSSERLIKIIRRLKNNVLRKQLRCQRKPKRTRRKKRS